MRVPIRKAGEYTNMKLDPAMTQQKYNELKDNLKRLKEIVHPPAAAEVKRLAAMGDFSENAAYQMAKGKLRSINEKIANLEKLISGAVIIQPDNHSDVVKLGSVVNVLINEQNKTYQILGSVETNPSAGIISYNSPLGKILLGKKVDDVVQMPVEGKNIEYKIIKIS